MTTPKYHQADVAMMSPETNYRDAVLDYVVGERVHTLLDLDLTFAEIEIMVQSGNFAQVDPNELRRALGMAIDGYWSDINEGYAARRGTEQQDHEDVARIEELYRALA